MSSIGFIGLASDCVGNSIFLEDLAKRLQTRKEDEVGSNKQKRPPEEETRVNGAEECNDSDRERDVLRQAPSLQSKRGK